MEIVKLPTFEHIHKVPSKEANFRKLRNPEELGVLIGTKSGIVLGNPFKFQFLSSVHSRGLKDTSAWFDPRHVMPIKLADFDVDFNNLLKCFSEVLISLKVDQNVAEAVVLAFSKISSECLDLPLFQGCAAFALDDEYVSLAETGIPRLLCYLTLQCVLKHGANEAKKKLDKASQIILSTFVIYDIENMLPTGVPEMLPKNFSKLITVSAFLGIAMAVAKKFMAISSVHKDLIPFTIVQLLIDSLPEITDSDCVNLSLPLTFRSENLFKYLKEGNSFDFSELDLDLLPCNDRVFIGSEPEEIYTRTVPNFYPMDFPSKSLADRQRNKILASGEDNWETNTNTSWCRTVDISHDLLPTTKGIFYERPVEKWSSEKQLDWTLAEKETRQVEVVVREDLLDVHSLAQAVEENRHLTYVLSCLVLHCNPIMTWKNVIKIVHDALQCKGKTCPSGFNCKVTDLLTSVFIDDYINKSLQIVFINNVAMLLNLSRRINLGSIRLSHQNVINFGLVGHQYIEITEEVVLGNSEDHQIGE